jgi:hypothetical protein
VIHGVVTEFKTSYGAVKRHQLEQVAKFASNIPSETVEMVFLRNPSATEI